MTQHKDRAVHLFQCDYRSRISDYDYKQTYICNTPLDSTLLS